MEQNLGKKKSKTSMPGGRFRVLGGENFGASVIFAALWIAGAVFTALWLVRAAAGMKIDNFGV